MCMMASQLGLVSRGHERPAKGTISEGFALNLRAACSGDTLAYAASEAERGYHSFS